MAWLLVAVFAVPILATLWAIGFGVMTAREKRTVWRILCGVQALVGAVFAAAGWLVFGSAFSEGGKSFAGFQIDVPRITSARRIILPVLGLLAIVLVLRQHRLRSQGRS